jgi:hypothetical protein
MNVLVVEPMKKPYMKDIDSGLHSLQREVGGYIEAIYPYEDLVGLVCNEEGKMEGLPLNRAIYSKSGEMFDIIAGKFLIVGLSEDNFSGLSDKLAEKYAKLFESPELFYSMNGRIEVQKVDATVAETAPEEVEHKDLTEPLDENSTSTSPSQRRLSIYQLKRSDDLHDIRFESYDYLQKNGIKCDIRNYDLVYSDHIRSNETLENLFYKFNMEHPEDFKGHSLSMSDVIVVKERGKKTAYYVDSFGFKQLDRFERGHVRTSESRNARDIER